MTFEIQRDRMTIIHVCPNGCDFEYERLRNGRTRFPRVEEAARRVFG